MTGPDTGGPPSGPATPNTPMGGTRRFAVYTTQNGSWRLTPRQRRRADHKQHRATKRALAR
jgi:hypothetical protein